jgi:hypothetical protein
MSVVQVTINLVKADSGSAGRTNSDFELGQVLKNNQEL